MDRRSIGTALWFSLCGFASSQTASVVGMVQDQSGRPVKDAFVSVLPRNLQSQNYVPASAVSGNDGSFELKGIDPGVYSAYAWNEDKGVPDARFLLLRGDQKQFADISISVMDTVKHVVVVMPPPDRELKLTIRDANSHEAIPYAIVKLTHAVGQPYIYSKASDRDGRYLKPVPAEPIAITVTKNGYLQWNYVSPVRKKPFIVADGSEPLSIVVNMVPIHASSPSK